MWRRVLLFERKGARHCYSSLGASASLLYYCYLLEREETRETNSKIANVKTLCEAATLYGREDASASLLSRRGTVGLLQDLSTKESLESRYHVDWGETLGVGTFGAVYLATDKRTGEKVALKKLPKTTSVTDNISFQREMNALLLLRQAGGHPNICSLRENFEEGDHYYLILDLVGGGEMFDHLVQKGAFSERDASRLVREVASALAFLHGLGVTHGDLKPENVMMSTRSSSDSVIKLVDFGCALINSTDGSIPEVFGDNSRKNELPSAGWTAAYCPPEVVGQKRPIQHPGMDMWALGVIVYIMLTGSHPFDLQGDASDEDIIRLVTAGKKPPLRNSPITAHLSESAIDLIEKLMDRNPETRLTADQMLDHPWVKGETASSSKMADSSKKLSMYRAFKTRISAKVFQNIVTWSDEDDAGDISRRVSLIERSFRSFDPKHKGYISKEDMREFTKKDGSESISDGDNQEGSSRLSLSGFSDLLAENMKNKYFPKGHIVYHEGEIGNHMYFINSGKVSVETSGSVVQRGPGDFFGEGALLHPKKLRSATIRCVTPVHAMEISREYFEKYLATSDSSLLLTIREKDKIRKRNRAKMILRLQNNLKETHYTDGSALFNQGDESDNVFLVESGKVDILMGKNRVFSATPGNMFGEYAPLTGKVRNCTAVCASPEGCTVHEMNGNDFRRLLEVFPEMKRALIDLRLRREFKKAVVLRLQKEFPYDNPREAFDAVKTDACVDGALSKEAIANLMMELNPAFTDEEIVEVIKSMDLTGSGTVTFEEFKKVFIANIKTSASI